MTGKVPIWYRISATLWLTAGLVWPATPAPQRCSLQPEHAAILVMQSPPVVKAKTTGACPAADYEEKSPGMAAFQVRNLCAKTGNGLLGNYLVELSSGQVWEDGATQKRVDSADVRTTRNRVCAMSVQGVIPSLLPQGHTSRAGVRRIGATTAARKKTRTSSVQ